ncbi:MAG: carboxylating nicotinate-nucleotide diphosphorylase [Candidatus Levybacteria bacterium]|nr:carboxylating nicotinate-nucleotide diphosphorylase [Candidatus Levybacteria bacterium]
MNRKAIINRYFQRKEQLLVSNKNYEQQVLGLFDWVAEADQVENDLTIKTLMFRKMGTAAIVSKQEGIAAGIEEIMFLLSKRTEITVVTHVVDGKPVSKGEILLTLRGENRDLLAFERIILNILARMSGIATYTNSFLSKLETIKNPPFLAATRKTPWMLLDKKAVAVGGGLTHRLNLSDFPLVKDNYLEVIKKEENISLQEAIRKALKRFSSSFFEIEVRNILEFQAIMQSLEKKKDCPLAIMLDNFELKSVMEQMEEIKKQPLYKHLIIEASGEITEQNLLHWAKTGVDLISIGALTHSSPTFNISMKIQ